jgi:hypothetical protein
MSAELNLQVRLPPSYLIKLRIFKDEMPQVLPVTAVLLF